MFEILSFIFSPPLTSHRYSLSLTRTHTHTLLSGPLALFNKVSFPLIHFTLYLLLITHFRTNNKWSSFPEYSTAYLWCMTAATNLQLPVHEVRKMFLFHLETSPGLNLFFEEWIRLIENAWDYFFVNLTNRYYRIRLLLRCFLCSWRNYLIILISLYLLLI